MRKKGHARTHKSLRADPTPPTSDDLVEPSERLVKPLVEPRKLRRESSSRGAVGTTSLPSALFPPSPSTMNPGQGSYLLIRTRSDSGSGSNSSGSDEERQPRIPYERIPDFLFSVARSCSAFSHDGKDSRFQLDSVTPNVSETVGTISEAVADASTTPSSVEVNSSITSMDPTAHTGNLTLPLTTPVPDTLVPVKQVYVVSSQYNRETEYVNHGFAETEQDARIAMAALAEIAYFNAAKLAADRAAEGQSPLFDTVPVEKISEGYAVRYFNAAKTTIYLYEISRGVPNWFQIKGTREQRIVRVFKIEPVLAFTTTK